jgi:uncharacterized membrane protein
MFGFGDLFQWERFITPSIIKVFYWLAVAIAILFGVSSVVSSLELMTANPFLGFVGLIGGVIGMVIGIVFARIVAEFVLIVFRINEHLGAIRNRDESAL